MEKDILTYRSYLATKRYRVVLDEISFDNENDLFPIRVFADYLLDCSKFEGLIQLLENKIQSAGDKLHIIWRIIAAIMFIHENRLEEALRLLSDGESNLESQCIVTYIYLRMNRLDLAQRMLKQMNNEDETLAQLAQSWLNIEIGGEKLQDAYFIFDDLNDKFTSSVLLMNNMAVCYMGQQKFDDAQPVLRDALDRESNNYDLLVNYIFYSQQTDNADNSVINRYLSLLKETSKNGELVEELSRKEAEFDRLCLNYTFKEAEKITC